MKPYVILNAAMTLDGKIATKKGSSEISGEDDLKRVHELRKNSDAIMVGINTVLADDPRLTVHKIPANLKDNPTRIVVDSKAHTPLKSRILNDEAPTIIAVTKKAPVNRLESLQKKAEVLICGDEQVNLKKLMEKLAKRGLKSLMLEGGSTLNYSMFEDDLIDEVRICIAPMIAGGTKSKTLVDGSGVDYMKNAYKLRLKKSYKLGNDLIVEYTVIHK